MVSENLLLLLCLRIISYNQLELIAKGISATERKIIVDSKHEVNIRINWPWDSQEEDNKNTL